MRISRGGTARAPITLRAVPGASATIDGVVDWEPGGDHWRVTQLAIEGAGSSDPTVQIHANGIRIDHTAITNEHQGASCIIDGYLQGGNTVSHGTVIDHNKIHDCGAMSSGPLNHGIYVCCGYGTRITDNYIWHNSGFGIQLYPDADGALVERNVIDGNVLMSGVTIGGDVYGGCHQTSGATVASNIITSNGRYGVESWWGCAVGGHNAVTRNCLWGNSSGAITPDVIGFIASRNIRANPGFINPGRHNYRLRRGSPCAAMAPRGSIGP